MTLKERITEDMKSAMRSKDTARLSTIRMLLAAVKQREVDERITLTDADLLSIIDKMIKQRRDSITQFAAGGRDDLVATETAEVDVLQAYLPQPLSDAEVDALIDEAIAAAGASATGAMGATGATGAIGATGATGGTAGAAMGKVMAELKPRIAGRADMGKVSGRVKSKLAG